MRYGDLKVGDHFIAMPLEEDLMPGRNVIMHLFVKLNDQDPVCLNSGQAARVSTGTLSSMPLDMPVLKIAL